MKVFDQGIAGRSSPVQSKRSSRISPFGFPCASSCSSGSQIDKVTLLRFVGAVGPVSVENARSKVGDVTVPDVLAPVWKLESGHLLAGGGRIEKTHLHFPSALRVDRKVHSLSVEVGAERKGFPRENRTGRLIHSSTFSRIDTGKDDNTSPTRIAAEPSSIGV